MRLLTQDRLALCSCDHVCLCQVVLSGANAAGCFLVRTRIMPWIGQLINVCGFSQLVARGKVLPPRLVSLSMALAAPDLAPVSGAKTADL